MSRVATLRRNLATFLRDPSQRVVRSDAEWNLFAGLAFDSYSKHVDEPEILRKAAFLEMYASKFPATVDEGQLLAGSRRIGHPAAKLSAAQASSARFQGNLGHIIVDYGMMLRTMITTFFNNGGFQFQANLLDAGQLRRAQVDPQGAADILVRVSGFSAKFTAMPERWQNVLIERVAKGL